MRLLRGIVCKAAVLVAMTGLLAPATANADPITFDGQGTWTLTNLGLNAVDLYTADGVNDTYMIQLTYSSLGYTGGATDYIKGVAVKVSGSVDAGVGGGTTAPGTWTFSLNVLNNNGCEGGDAGFGCYVDGTSAVTGGPAAGTTYSWTFLLDIDGGLFTGPLEASIKALFKNANGSNAGLLSENITLQGGGGGGGGGGQTIPEPATLSLFGLAIAGVARRMRRRVS